MRTVVLGAPGQLGRDLCPRLPGDVIPMGRADCDITDTNRLNAVLSEKRPNIVINCAAYNLVDKAETETGTAFSVNAWAVNELAKICAKLDACLVHFSTDYVFGVDSTWQKPLSENDPPGPVSVYGLSKLSGEYLVRSACPKHFVIRTCGLYGVWGSGGKGGNFVETMLRLAGTGKPVRVVNDQRCTPSFTADVAAAVILLIGARDYGLYHLTNGGDCTWFEFASEIFRQSKLNVDLQPITSAQFGAAAVRPAYSVLSNEKLERLGISSPRHWKNAIATYLQERIKK